MVGFTWNPGWSLLVLFCLARGSSSGVGGAWLWGRQPHSAVVGCWRGSHYSIPSEQITFLRGNSAWRNFMGTRALAGVVDGTRRKDGWNLGGFGLGFFTLESRIVTIAKSVRAAQASVSEET